MSLAGVAIGAVIGGGVVFAALRRWRGAQRERFVREYTLPLGLYRAVRQHRPELADKDLQLANRALRQFFLAYLKGGHRYVSMPSKLADELWHEFILHTRAYAEFCDKAFGRMLHHSPATALGADRKRNEGLRRCWWQACKEEQINPRLPTRLPLLFALDAKIGIPDGFRYSLSPAFLPTPSDAGSSSSGDAFSYSVADFSDNSIDGCTDGFGDGDGTGDADGDGGDGGDGGGDGGGCGGGCGGGD